MLFSLAHFVKIPELDLDPEGFEYPCFRLSSEKISECFIDRNIVDIMLGKQAEILFEKAIDISQRYTRLASNVQIQGATKTIGELDYIIHDSEMNETLHIELASKFYLLDTRINMPFPAQWMGPNRKDSLQQKMDKMQRRQFPLLFRQETQRTLAELDIDLSSIIQKTCIKAFLFLPRDFKISLLPKNYGACHYGYYVNFSEFLADTSDAEFAIPTKKQWLITPKFLQDWLPRKEAARQIKLLINNKRSPLVYKKCDVGFEAFFVVWW